MMAYLSGLTAPEATEKLKEKGLDYESRARAEFEKREDNSLRHWCIEMAIKSGGGDIIGDAQAIYEWMKK
jgi:hypothetical protein